MSLLLLYLVVLLQLQLALVSSFSASTPSQTPLVPPDSNSKHNGHNGVQVKQVESNEDIISLADLRYQEWMSGDDDPNPPKLSSFRMATAEIYHERKAEGSMVFLATMLNNDNDGRVGVGVETIIGAAELSPIELQGVFAHITNDNDNEAKSLYITDVVTSSSHRRLGIGSKLMDAIERTAWDLSAQFVFLHVEHDNIVARSFYERLGYYACIVDNMNVDTMKVEGGEEGNIDIDTAKDGIIYLSLEEGRVLPQSQLNTSSSTRREGIIAMDASRLAENASTVGQLLMMKRISAPTTILNDGKMSTTTSTPATDTSTAVIGGFGKQGAKKAQKQKKRKKR